MYCRRSNTNKTKKSKTKKINCQSLLECSKSRNALRWRFVRKSLKTVISFSFPSIEDNYYRHLLLCTCTIGRACFHPSFPPSLLLSPSSLCGRARSPGISMHPKKKEEKKRHLRQKEEGRQRRGAVFAPGGDGETQSGNAVDSCLFERRRERLSLSGLTGRQPPSPVHATGSFFFFFSKTL